MRYRPHLEQLRHAWKSGNFLVARRGRPKRPLYQVTLSRGMLEVEVCLYVHSLLFEK